MKKYVSILLVVLCSANAFPQTVASESPISMEQLMQSLRIRGGNWHFVFDKPVIARITTSVSSFPDGKEMTSEVFTSDKPSSEISLFYMDAPSEIGEYPRPNKQNTNEMRFLLSDSKETAGTRIVRYVDKFSMAPWVGESGRLSHYRPAIAVNPKLNTEYVLNYYARAGDPYTVTATICFVSDIDDFKNVAPYVPGEPRQFKSTNDTK